MHRFGLAFLASIVWFSAGEARAFCRLTTAEPSSAGVCSTQGKGLAWNRQCISYSVVEREKQDIPLGMIRDVIDTSFEQWVGVECNTGPLPMILGQTEQLGACTTAQYNQFGPNANTIMFLNSWDGPNFPDEAFGLTLVWHDPDTGEIFDADMQLNETIAPIALCDGDCSDRVVDLSNVVTHEAGHFLGLGHSNIVGATMSANALLGETSKRSVEQDDRDGVCSIYGRLRYPECVQADGDFSPDRGFSSRCGTDNIEGSGCQCSAPRPHTSSLSGLLAIGAVALVLAAFRRRSRD